MSNVSSKLLDANSPHSKSQRFIQKLELELILLIEKPKYRFEQAKRASAQKLLSKAELFLRALALKIFDSTRP